MSGVLQVMMSLDSPAILYTHFLLVGVQEYER